MNRATLHVESVGQGPSIVLLHGWAMHGGIWGPWLLRLAARHRVHVVDLPGHGHSAGVRFADLDGVVDEVAASVPQGAAVIGWSLGALVALRWAVVSPRAVSRLVLIAATPRFVAGADWPYGIDEPVLTRFADELRIAYRLTLQRFLTLQLQGTAEGKRTLGEMRGALFARGEPTGVALLGGLDALRAADLRAELATIAQPALVVAGDRDTLVPATASRFLAQGLPRAEFMLVPGAGHVPFLSHPETVANAVERFVDGA